MSTQKVKCPRWHYSKVLKTKFPTTCESEVKIPMLCYSFCQQEKLPMTFQSCVIPKECQVSEWLEWSPCSKTCHDVTSPTGTRVRTRTIKQLPIGSEKECPELEEKEPCLSQGDGAVLCATWVKVRVSCPQLSDVTNIWNLLYVYSDLKYFFRHNNIEKVNFLMF